MKANPTPMSVVSFCKDINEKSIIVNRDYQRNDSIWTPYQRSYFIESIILQFPIPKIFLYAKYDTKKRESIREIVDGQQRTQAMLLFIRNKLTLSKRLDTESLRGKKYNGLTEEQQESFLSYLLSIDEFSGVSEDEVRESFTRMNQHTITLNPEELRHANYRGQMKGLVLDLAKKYREIFLEYGVLSRRDVIRMADTKIMAEIIYTLLRGFNTHKSEELNQLYGDFEDTFPERQEIEDWVSDAIDWWYENCSEFLNKMRSKHIFYTLIAACAEVVRPGSLVGFLTDDERSQLDHIREEDFNIEDLEADIVTSKIKIDDVDEDDNQVPGVRFPIFIEACRSGTNVRGSKVSRFQYLYVSISN